MLTLAEGQWTDFLGYVVNLRDQKDIGAVHTLNGRSIFKSLPPECYTKIRTVNPIRSYSRSKFESTNSFYESLASEVGLSGNFLGQFTMGLTLKEKSQNTYDGSVEVAGTSVNIMAVASTAIIKKDCIYGFNFSLSDEITNTFKALPTVNQPELDGSWAKYQDFLNSFGSHVLTHKNYGASVKQFTFSEKVQKYTEKQLNLKSCIDFGLGDKIPFTLGICGGISRDERNSVSELTVTEHTEIRGGTPTTGAELHRNRSDALINKLFKEGMENETVINYEYTPIWNILRSRFQDSEFYPLALNLEQYYRGYLDFGCSSLRPEQVKRRATPLRSSVDDLRLRRFEFSPDSTKENPEYWCVLEREGCHRDEDCKSETSNGVVKSYCYGGTSGCVEYLSSSSESVAPCVTIREKQSGDSREGINQSCYFNETSGTAKCNLEYSRNKAIWSRYSNDFSSPTCSPTITDTVSGSGKAKLENLLWLGYLSGGFYMYIIYI